MDINNNPVEKIDLHLARAETDLAAELKRLNMQDRPMTPGAPLKRSPKIYNFPSRINFDEMGLGVDESSIDFNGNFRSSRPRPFELRKQITKPPNLLSYIPFSYQNSRYEESFQTFRAELTSPNSSTTHQIPFTSTQDSKSTPNYDTSTGSWGLDNNMTSSLGDKSKGDAFERFTFESGNETTPTETEYHEKGGTAMSTRWAQFEDIIASSAGKTPGFTQSMNNNLPGENETFVDTQQLARTLLHRASERGASDLLKEIAEIPDIPMTDAGSGDAETPDTESEEKSSNQTSPESNSTVNSSKTGSKIGSSKTKSSTTPTVTGSTTSQHSQSQSQSQSQQFEEDKTFEQPEAKKEKRGAIMFKVPGRLTHKTTIKLAHFPQNGNNNCTSVDENNTECIVEDIVPESACSNYQYSPDPTAMMQMQQMQQMMAYQQQQYYGRGMYYNPYCYPYGCR